MPVPHRDFYRIPPRGKKKTTKKTTKRTTKPRAQAAKKIPAKKKMSQLDAAVKVLGQAKNPMSCEEMVEAMAKKKLWTSPSGKTPDQTLYASILRDLRKGKDARFKKVAPGKFALATRK